MSLFSVEPEGEHFWLCDGGVRVMLFVRLPGGLCYANAVFLQPRDAAPPSLPTNYHSATAIGAQLDFRWRWGQNWGPMELVAVELDASSATVRFSRRQEIGRGEQDMEIILRRTTALENRYVLQVRSVLRADTAVEESIEFLNFLPADVGNSWPECKCFRATVHEKEPGKFERRPHSQLTVLEKFFWADARAFRRAHVPEPTFAEVFRPARREEAEAAPYAVSHLFKPFAPRGTLFFTGEAIVPAVRMLRATAPVVLHTCDVWYDEHLCLTRGTPLDDGRSLYEVEYEAGALSHHEATQLERGACEVVWSGWVRETEYPAFFCGQRNDFVKAASREFSGATGLFFTANDARAALFWRRATDRPGRGAIQLNTIDSSEPTSGQYYQSLRGELAGARPWLEAFPLGFSLHVDAGDELEFSAMIRVEGTAQAWLEMREAYWGRFHAEHAHELRRQTVASDRVSVAQWTEVRGALTASIPGSLAMIYLRIEGRGCALFTELLVRRRPARAPTL